MDTERSWAALRYETNTELELGLHVCAAVHTSLSQLRLLTGVLPKGCKNYFEGCHWPNQGRETQKWILTH